MYQGATVLDGKDIQSTLLYNYGLPYDVIVI